MPKQQVSRSRVIPAAPEHIFALLVDPAKHALFDGSGTIKGARGSAGKRLTLGSTFGMDMRILAPYRITNTVVEFEENVLIAWRHFYGHRWRWHLAARGHGQTEVTETFDWSTARTARLLGRTQIPARNTKAIERSLRLLDEHFRAQ
ncbi:uncharacterized protein YndB with AHSA1/START domain [Tamaricihabitans halophyticus]|uniref:Uncharacterized protein YndB with AHSA1/START domain n=1 Tax=Tamaricihabitans halophyticus TaxID=1262583 RepID=A0A4R2R0U4_9PSEU|nr:SRPBCC family protein [Tamaricihabitans halophyticus]TCP55199.1 uncharacterized protein YndB with AHSA1/START domain [Tamaricihabitans halophyticus]